MYKGTSEGEGQHLCVCLLSFLLGNNLCSGTRHHCLCSAPVFALLRAVLRWPTCIFCVCVCARARTRAHMLSPSVSLTLWNPMDHSLLGSPVHGIFQVRILEQVAISPSRDLPNPGMEPASLAPTVPVGRFFHVPPSTAF